MGLGVRDQARKSSWGLEVGIMSHNLGFPASGNGSCYPISSFQETDVSFLLSNVTTQVLPIPYLAHDDREQVLTASQFSMFNKHNSEPVTVLVKLDR